MPPTERVDPDAIKYLKLDDFSAGCYSNGGSVVGNTTDRSLPAPPGAADAENTYACYAIPSGGLAALPGITATYVWPGNFKASGTTYVTGILIHDELGNGTTEAILIGEYDDGVNHQMQAMSYVIETVTATNIVLTTETTGVGIFGSPYPQMTRMANAAPTTTPGHPSIVWPSGGPAQPAGITSVYVYPDPATPTLYPPRNLITGAAGAQTSVAGQLNVHQSRVIIFAGTAYGWPTGGSFNTNENINFTDPPNSTVLGQQNTVLAAEEPYGYGAAGSISAGEFFVVKKRGGGLIVSGDIFAPNVTLLPGVQSTGNIYGSGESTPGGFFYASFDAGAWVWNGSNTSRKVSQNLDDSFFLPVEFGPMASNNYGFYFSHFGDKVYCSNNWMYDTRNQAWWTYWPRAAQGGQDLFWTQPINGNFIYAAQLSFTNSNKAFMYRFDPATPAQIYQWQSLPLHLPGEVDRVSDIREVLLRVSSSIPGASITVSILDKGTVVSAQATSVSPSVGPDYVRFNFGSIGVTEPALRIRVANSGVDMPIIHGIEIGYKPRAHQAANA